MGESALTKLAKSRRVRGWQQLVEEESKLRAQGSNVAWIFRAEGTTGPIKTSLEKALDGLGVPLAEAPVVEDRLLREFKRRCHLYVPNPPPDDHFMEWSALLRHYGGPSRLLDWTYSCFVAAYFATVRVHSESVIWALDSDWLFATRLRAMNCCMHRALEEDQYMRKKATLDLACSCGHHLVYPLNPYRLNARLAAQRGVFLCPGDVATKFEDNLVAMLPNKAGCAGRLYRFTIPNNPEVRAGILHGLDGIGVSGAAMFPGLPGFADSLNALVALRRFR